MAWGVIAKAQTKAAQAKKLPEDLNGLMNQASNRGVKKDLELDFRQA